MSFSVGDIVDNCGTEYVVDDVDSDGDCHVYRRSNGVAMGGYHEQSILTLVTPAGPPTPVLTGMTKFFKGIKEKTNATT
jgi:uncharacterized protein YodC (DUF2158 family)